MRTSKLDINRLFIACTSAPPTPRTYSLYLHRSQDVLVNDLAKLNFLQIYDIPMDIYAYILVSCSHTYTPFPSFVTLVSQIDHSPSYIIAYIIPYDDLVR